MDLASIDSYPKINIWNYNLKFANVSLVPLFLFYCLVLLVFMFVLYPDYNLSGIRFGGVMISVLASSVVDGGFSTRSGSNEIIGMSCILCWARNTKE
jgi:hypothetical protein